VLKSMRSRDLMIVSDETASGKCSSMTVKSTLPDGVFRTQEHRVEQGVLKSAAFERQVARIPET
jgi:hypothetical protein